MYSNVGGFLANNQRKRVKQNSKNIRLKEDSSFLLNIFDVSPLKLRRYFWDHQSYAFWPLSVLVCSIQI